MKPRININATNQVRRVYAEILDPTDLLNTPKPKTKVNNSLRYDQVERRRKLRKKVNFKTNVRYRKAVA